MASISVLLRATRFSALAGRQFNGNARLFLPRTDDTGEYQDLHRFLVAASVGELTEFQEYASCKLEQIFPMDEAWKAHALPSFVYAVELANDAIDRRQRPGARSAHRSLRYARPLPPRRLS
ncbi:MAG: hypothetical protein JRG76_07710 [Deltaproteobacteria bacterium]|nr:hypothetical protein [Deltaproteobacteria bacterium]MBW2414382.1 hypothetical protein [Deltaproteobacteria bacterium]